MWNIDEAYDKYRTVGPAENMTSRQSLLLLLTYDCSPVDPTPTG